MLEIKIKMKNKKFLVKLIPEDKFFFGNEKTFNTVKGSNYLVKSNYFPQQTGVLGLIRHQLLIQNSLIPLNKENREEAGKLIGPYSFRVQDEEMDFGIIHQISPLFICGPDNIFLFPANKEYQWVDNEIERDGNEVKDGCFKLRNYTKNPYKGTSFTGVWDDHKPKANDYIPFLEGFNPKNDLPDLLIDSNNQIRNYDYEPGKKDDDLFDGIFVRQQQVGIRKDYQGKTDDDSYYLQTFLKMKEGYGFAFTLELKNSNDYIFKSDQVVFGGEQSMFDMEVEELKTEIEWPQYKATPGIVKLVLLSDAYVHDDIFASCEFAVSESLDFRFLQTSTKETGKWYAVSGDRSDNNKPAKSKKFNLLKKGSVLYGNPEQITKKLRNINFEKIGYNNFKIVKS